MGKTHLDRGSVRSENKNPQSIIYFLWYRYPTTIPFSRSPHSLLKIGQQEAMIPSDIASGILIKPNFFRSADR